MSLRPIRPQLLDDLQALASLPTNHHLVDYGIFRTCAIIADALALARNTLASFSLSLFG